MTSNAPNDTTPTPDGAASLSDDSVTETTADVNRPARGYHKFRNGMLNVKPKGHEKAMVQQNQKTLLLSLPTEVRTRIWAYVLGGKTYRPCPISTRKHQFKPSPTEPEHGMALLRVCRQIYSETASLPLTLNTFSYSFRIQDRNAVISALARLKAYRRKHIKSVQLEIGYDEVMYRVNVNGAGIFLQSVTYDLPKVKQIRVLVFSRPDENPLLDTFIEVEESPVVDGVDVQVIVEAVDTTRESYDDQWKGNEL